MNQNISVPVDQHCLNYDMLNLICALTQKCLKHNIVKCSFTVVLLGFTLTKQEVSENNEDQTRM